ncbi:hypothetical protein Q73_09760 [Bacillus coahuilensis m2-6]|uniref:Metallo-beta-lactamase domain-containing protein n=1 Tax=Bacillus coahuilensis p1.1.43 TaxID=1150625 RepID=A0A147K7L7_9BACI|nr:DNA internalization-related competence protein ComEC/Rec2 [Bacillus coahuilensis]KUP06047.1 hypothetical protein Q75_10350 [Bacillus coahuilensis p1.1.43]KUP07255.1 hypothetical protein Q73_09760 [Bacillus coahuilensis m2-6]
MILHIQGGIILLLFSIYISFLLKPSFTTLLLAATIAVFGSVMYFFEETENNTELTGQEQSLLLDISSPLLATSYGFKGESTAQSGEKIALRLYTDEEIDLQSLVGKCLLEGHLQEPEGARNDHGFNYEKFLYYENVHWIFEVKRITYCEPLNSFWLQDTYRQISEWRIHQIERIEGIFGYSVPLVQALVFGHREGIEESILDAYQEIGVIHLLAISGLHVSVITVWLFLLFIRLGITKEWAKGFLLIVLPLYVLLTGAAPPVIRASSMAMLLFFFSFMRFKIAMIDLVSITFLLQLILSPYEIMTVSFQLTYMVCYALVLSAPKILTNTGSYMYSMLTISITSFLGSLPILVNTFFEVSLIGLLVNVVYVPLFTVILLPLSLFCYLCTLLSTSWAEIPIRLLNSIVQWTDSLTLWISERRVTTFITGKLNLMEMIGLILGVIAFYIFWEKKRLLGLLLISLSLMFYVVVDERLDNKGYVYIVDVGQGDSIIIDLPRNEGVIMIDTGGIVSFGEEIERASIYKLTLDQFLNSKGIGAIDLLLLTHGDYDHIGGAKDLILDRKVKELVYSTGSEKVEEMQKILKVAETRGVIHRPIRAPFKWETPSSTFQLLHPSDDQYEGNNDSLVILAELGGVKWLFTGDLESEGESVITKKYEIDADVLKVGHHGSHTSTSLSFLKEVSPEYAIISAGKNNSFGHPHKDVVERLKAEGVTILSTRENGGITYTFTGSGGTFSTVHP